MGSVMDCPEHGGKLYLMRKGDLWMYPGIALNHKEIIRSPLGNVTLQTLALSPKIFLLNDVLSEQECEELVRIGTEETERAGSDVFTVTAAKSPLVSLIQARISAILRLPIELIFTTYGRELASPIADILVPSFSFSFSFYFFFSFQGLEISRHLPAQPGRILVQPKRDFTLKPDYEHLRDELDRGRNTMVSVGSDPTNLMTRSSFPTRSLSFADCVLPSVEANRRPLLPAGT